MTSCSPMFFFSVRRVTRARHAAGFPGKSNQRNSILKKQHRAKSPTLHVAKDAITQGNVKNVKKMCKLGRPNAGSHYLPNGVFASRRYVCGVRFRDSPLHNIIKDYHHRTGSTAPRIATGDCEKRSEPNSYVSPLM